MDEKVLKGQETEEAKKGAEEAAKEEAKISETWAQDVIQDLDDYIESMGHYLRQ